MDKTLGLVMIVRNEAHDIEATLSTIKPHIDYWTILDTGSNDGTQSVIKQFMEGVPGELHEGPFEDFSSARNRVLDLHGEQTAFTLMLDADDRVESGDALVSFLKKASASGCSAYQVRREMVASWWVPLVLRASAKWRYRGRVHEYVCGPRGEIATERIDGPIVRHVRTPISVIASRNRWNKDVELLLQDWDSGVEPARTAFYLGQTYECLGEFEKSLHWYSERAGMAGWSPETFEALMRKGRCYSRMNKWPEAMNALLEAHSFDPNHAEPLFVIAENYYIQQKMDLCFLFARRAAEIDRPKEALFIDEDVYSWKANDLVAISAYYVSKRTNSNEVFEIGKKAADDVLRVRPDDVRIINNRRFYGDLEGAK